MADRQYARRTRGDDAAPPGESSPSDPDDLAAKARDTCYRLLAVRARTRLELEQALRRKEIPDDVARTIIDKFDAAGLIDDQAFAESWVQSRHT